MSRGRLIAANTGTFSAPLPVVIDAVQAAGYTGLEVWKTDIDALPGGADAMAERLEQAGLEVPAFQLLRDYEGSGAARRERLAEAEALMDIMGRIGARTLLVCSNTRPDSSPDHAERIRDLRVLAELAQSRNMRIGFEPLAWSQWINDYEQACACVNAVDHPSFGMVLDVFHLFSRKTSLGVLDDIPIDKLFMVQICNAVSMPLPIIEVARHHRRFPSDGEWPVAEVVQRIEARGFDGYYSMEVFNDDYRREDPFQVAQAAILRFRGLFGDEVDAAVEKTASSSE